MATFTLIANPARVVANNTSEHELLFDPNVFKEIPNAFTVVVTTGTVQFNTNGNVAANGASLTTTTAPIKITVGPGRKLNFKANASNDAFIVSF